jgi:hypothetical protein
VRCVVTFHLKPGVSADDYLEWFRRVNVPAVEKVPSITEYRVWRIGDVVDGTAGFEFLEEMEITDRAAFERDLEQVPDMAAMVEEWYARVEKPVVAYADEVDQRVSDA